MSMKSFLLVKSRILFSYSRYNLLEIEAELDENILKTYIRCK